jgi:hypothetical protein
MSTSPGNSIPVALVGGTLVWADLLIVPWLLLPWVRDRGWIAVDQVVVLTLLLVALVMSPRSQP